MLQRKLRGNSAPGPSGYIQPSISSNDRFAFLLLFRLHLEKAKILFEEIILNRLSVSKNRHLHWFQCFIFHFHFVFHIYFFFFHIFWPWHNRIPHYPRPECTSLQDVQPTHQHQRCKISSGVWLWAEPCHTSVFLSYGKEQNTWTERRVFSNKRTFCTLWLT